MLVCNQRQLFIKLLFLAFLTLFQKTQQAIYMRKETRKVEQSMTGGNQLLKDHKGREKENSKKTNLKEK